MNNTFQITDSKIYMNINENSQVKDITFGSTVTTTGNNNGYLPAADLINKSDLKDASNSYITIVNSINIAVNGKVNNVFITAVTKLILSGSGSLNKLTVGKTADGTMLALSLRTYFTSEADIILSLCKGADSSQVYVASDAYSEIENMTGSGILINFGSNYYITSNGYAVKVSGGVCNSIGQISSSSVLKLAPSYSLPITATAIHSGDGLWASALSGTFSYNATPVEGSLTWTSPYIIVNDSGYYQWVFIPADMKHYNIITGTALVTIIK
jgi:hypothetical protein